MQDPDQVQMKQQRHRVFDAEVARTFYGDTFMQHGSRATASSVEYARH